MKQTVDMQRVQDDMRPGRISHTGFLGHDRRLLIEILDGDDAEVKRLGQTHAALAARMRSLRESGRGGLGEAVSVAPHFEVRVDGVPGVLACPFHHAGRFPKVNTTVTNMRSGRKVTYSDLSIHLIAEHGFYQGAGSPFRLDPAELMAVLEPGPVADAQ